MVEREITNIEKNEGPLNDTEYCSSCVEREKVRESFINATCVLCRSGEKPYLQWFGGKNWDGRYQTWVHNVKLGGCTEVKTCPASAIRQLDLTKDLAASSTKGISIKSFKDMAALDEADEVKAPCGHAAKHLKYDQPTRTIRCQVCVNPTPWHLSITEAEAQMDEGSQEKGNG